MNFSLNDVVQEEDSLISSQLVSNDKLSEQIPGFDALGEKEKAAVLQFVQHELVSSHNDIEI